MGAKRVDETATDLVALFKIDATELTGGRSVSSLAFYAFPSALSCDLIVFLIPGSHFVVVLSINKEDSTSTWGDSPAPLNEDSPEVVLTGRFLHST